jgi:hypothetical protein
MLEILAYAALALALLPAVVTAVNLAFFRVPPPDRPAPPPKVSLLIPARDEEENIGDALRAALASEGVELEVGSSTTARPIARPRSLRPARRKTRACGSWLRPRCLGTGAASSMPAMCSPVTRAIHCWCSSTPTCASRPTC